MRKSQQVREGIDAQQLRELLAAGIAPEELMAQGVDVAGTFVSVDDSQEEKKEFAEEVEEKGAVVFFDLPQPPKQSLSRETKSPVISSDTKLLPKLLQIGDKIAEGSFGVVYQGTYNGLPIAAKQLKLAECQHSGFSEQEILEDFEAEALRFAMLNHPNIVTYYGTCETAGNHYMVIEFCSGGDLLTAVRTGKLAWADKWRFALGIAHGLAYLHAQGARHSDLKLNNVLLDNVDFSKAKAKLTDFGLTRLDALLGTDSHARKKIQHEEFEHQAADDVYRFGARILCELAIEQLPREMVQIGISSVALEQSMLLGHVIDGDQPVTTLISGKQITHDVIIPVTCPPRIADLIRVCCAEEPSARPKAFDIITSLETVAVDFMPAGITVKQSLLPKIDSIIHPARRTLYHYIPPFASRAEILEDWDSYWQKLEEQQKTKIPELWSHIEEFFINPTSRVLVVLADGGIGKTLSGYHLTAYLLRKAWQQQEGFLPILLRPGIHSFKHSELAQGITKSLQSSPYNLTPEAIAILKKEHRVLFILDGYDELTVDIAPENLPEKLGLDTWPQSTKLMITSRRAGLENISERARRFDFDNHHDVSFLLPFRMEQISKYLSAHLGWETQDEAEYLAQLKQANILRATLRNPFVLSLYLRIYAIISKINPNELTRYRIYEEAIKYWFTQNQGHLEGPVLTEITGLFPFPKERSQDFVVRASLALEKSFDEFAGNIAKVFLDGKILTSSKEHLKEKLARGLSWLNLQEDVTETAGVIYDAQHQEQSQSPALMLMADFQRHNMNKLNKFLASCPLQQRVSEYNYTHKSFFEYFAFQHILRNILAGSIDDLIQALSTIPLQDESEILMFGYEFLQQAEPGEREKVEDGLFAVIYASRGSPQLGRSAANAITMLNWMNVSLQNKNFQDISIPEADLSNSVLMGSDFTDANLEGICLTNACLNGAYFNRTCLKQMQLDHLPVIARNACIADIFYIPFYNDIALVENKKIFFLNASTGVQTRGELIYEGDQIVKVAFSFDGLYLLLAGLKEIQIWNWERNTTCFPRPIRGYSDIITSAAFGTNSDLLAIGCKDGNIYLFPWRGGTILDPFKMHNNSIICLAFNHDDKILASVSIDGEILLWDIVNKRPIGKFVQQTKHDSLTKIAFSPQENLLAYSNADGTINLFDIIAGKLVDAGMLLTKDSITDLSFTPDGRLLIVAGEKLIYMWDVRTKILLHEPLAGHRSSITGLSINSNGSLLVSSDITGEIYCWKLANKVSNRKVLVGHRKGVVNIASCLEHKIIITASQDNTVAVWDMTKLRATGSLLTFPRSSRIILNANSKIIVIIDSDSISFRDVVTKMPYGKSISKSKPCGNIAISDRFLAIIEHDVIELWDITSGLLHKSIAIQGIPHMVFFNNFLIFNQENKFFILNINAGERARSIITHKNNIVSFILSQDSSQLAFCDANTNNVIYLCDVASGTQLSIIQGDIANIAINSKGRVIIFNKNVLHDLQNSSFFQWYYTITSVCFYDDHHVCFGDEHGNIGYLELNETFKFLCLFSNAGISLDAKGMRLTGSVGLQISELDLFAQRGANEDDIEALKKAIRELHNAAQSGDTERLSSLLESKADVDQTNEHGMTPLLLASQNDHLGVVQALLKANATVDKADSEGTTPLQASCELNHIEIICELLTAKADPNQGNHENWRPLAFAAAEGHVAAIKILLDAKAAIDEVDNIGGTALFHACYRGHIEAVQVLLASGANVNHLENKGWAPIHFACMAGHLEIVKTLLMAKASFMSKTYQDGLFPLFLACENGHLNIVEFLLGIGAPVDMTTNFGTSSLFIASRRNHTKIILALLKANADINKSTKSGFTPLFIASQVGNDEAVSVLSQYGISLERNLVEFNKASPLHIAALMGRTTILYPLITAGFNINQPLQFITAIPARLDHGLIINKKEQNGATPLFLAAHEGHVSTVLELLRYDANIDQARKDGATPLYISCKQDHEALTLELITQRADIDIAEQHAISLMEQGVVKTLQKLKSEITHQREERKSPEPLIFSSIKGKSVVESSSKMQQDAAEYNVKKCHSLCSCNLL